MKTVVITKIAKNRSIKKSQQNVNKFLLQNCKSKKSKEEVQSTRNLPMILAYNSPDLIAQYKLQFKFLQEFNHLKYLNCLKGLKCLKGFKSSNCSTILSNSIFPKSFNNSQDQKQAYLRKTLIKLVKFLKFIKIKEFNNYFEEIQFLLQATNLEKLKKVRYIEENFSSQKPIQIQKHQIPSYSELNFKNLKEQTKLNFRQTEMKNIVYKLETNRETFINQKQNSYEKINVKMKMDNTLNSQRSLDVLNLLDQKNKNKQLIFKNIVRHLKGLSSNIQSVEDKEKAKNKNVAYINITNRNSTPKLKKVNVIRHMTSSIMFGNSITSKNSPFACKKTIGECENSLHLFSKKLKKLNSHDLNNSQISQNKKNSVDSQSHYKIDYVKKNSEIYKSFKSNVLQLIENVKPNNGFNNHNHNYNHSNSNSNKSKNNYFVNSTHRLAKRNLGKGHSLNMNLISEKPRISYANLQNKISKNKINNSNNIKKFLSINLSKNSFNTSLSPSISLNSVNNISNINSINNVNNIKSTNCFLTNINIKDSLYQKEKIDDSKRLKNQFDKFPNVIINKNNIEKKDQITPQSINDLNLNLIDYVKTIDKHNCKTLREGKNSNEISDFSIHPLKIKQINHINHISAKYLNNHIIHQEIHKPQVQQDLQDLQGPQGLQEIQKLSNKKFSGIKTGKQEFHNENVDSKIIDANKTKKNNLFKKKESKNMLATNKLLNIEFPNKNKCNKLGTINKCKANLNLINLEKLQQRQKIQKIQKIHKIPNGTSKKELNSNLDDFDSKIPLLKSKFKSKNLLRNNHLSINSNFQIQRKTLIEIAKPKSNVHLKDADNKTLALVKKLSLKENYFHKNDSSKDKKQIKMHNKNLKNTNNNLKLMNFNCFEPSCSSVISSNFYDQIYLKNKKGHLKCQVFSSRNSYSHNISKSFRFPPNSQQMKTSHNTFLNCVGKNSKLSPSKDEPDIAKVRLYSPKGSNTILIQESGKYLNDSPCPESPERNRSQHFQEEPIEPNESNIEEISHNPENFISCEIEENGFIHKIPEENKEGKPHYEITEHDDNSINCKSKISIIKKYSQANIKSNNRLSLNENQVIETFNNEDNIHHNMNKRTLRNIGNNKITGYYESITKSKINENYIKSGNLLNNLKNIEDSSKANKIFVSLYSTMDKVNQNCLEESNYSTLQDDILYIEGKECDNFNFPNKYNANSKDSLLFTDMGINE